MTSPTPPSPRAELRGRRVAGFTLIELILVMVLLVISAGLVAPHLSAFFRSRVLEQESRRLLDLTHYGQSRAVAEGVPVGLWIDASIDHYGLEILPGYATEDPRAVEYAYDSSLTISTEAATTPAPDEDTGTVTPTPDIAIIFNPDGQIDPASVSRIVIRQNDGHALDLVPNPLGTAYQIVPDDPHAQP
jgi:type II secretion system protein H